MKPLTYDDRMRIAYVLNRNAGKRAQSEETAKFLKKLFGKDKVKIIK